MPRKRKWTVEDLRQAIKSNISIRGVLVQLNLHPTGGNYVTIHSYIKELQIDTSHFKGKGWSKGGKIKGIPKWSFEEILIENSSYTNTSHLKHRLLSAGMIRNLCYICGIADWHDKPLALHLDHINGKRNDHRIENLRVLCPNCHSQTETYAGKNFGKGSY